MTTITKSRYERRKIYLPAETVLPVKEIKVPFFRKIGNYIAAEAAGETRFKWVGFTMAAQSIVITPLTAIVILSTGNLMPLWFVAVASMYATFIPGLAGLSVRVIIPVFFINLLINVLVIATAIGYALAG